MNTNSRNNLKIIIGMGLIICGVALLAFVTVYNLRNYILEKKLLKQYEAYRYSVLEASGIVLEEDTVSDDKSEITPVVTVDVENVGPVPDGHYILGVMEIPSIKCKEPIREEVISYCLGHMPGTSEIGGTGNCAIAGHRNYNGGRYFHNIDKLLEGDEIIIKTLEGEYTYKVTESFVVLPEDTYVLDDYDGATLTLITCTPMYIGSHRLIVRAKLADTKLYFE